MSGGEVKHGIFIDIKLSDGVAGDAELGHKLAEVCPVDIFIAADEGTGIVSENLDECVLCNLCVEAASAAGAEGGIEIVKLYE